jgi:hypothetical protein
MRLLLAVLAAMSSGCINLPPAVERELKCPDPRAASHFGEEPQCARDLE